MKKHRGKKPAPKPEIKRDLYDSPDLYGEKDLHEFKTHDGKEQDQCHK
jgi:hypothetical protein